jgi:propionyl-CoA carboxylase alpha chain
MIAVSYRALRDGSFRMGDGAIARIHAWSDRGIDLEIDGRRRRTRITRAGNRLVIQSLRGDVELVVQPRFAKPESSGPSGVLVAPMPGKVIDLRVAAGDSVRAGQVLVVLEAMKMEHPLSAAEDGIVTEVRVSAGEQVENGALLLVVTATSGVHTAKGDS